MTSARFDVAIVGGGPAGAAAAVPASAQARAISSFTALPAGNPKSAARGESADAS